MATMWSGTVAAGRLTVSFQSLEATQSQLTNNLTSIINAKAYEDRCMFVTLSHKSQWMNIDKIWHRDWNNIYAIFYPKIMFLWDNFEQTRQPLVNIS